MNLSKKNINRLKVQHSFNKMFWRKLLWVPRIGDEVTIIRDCHWWVITGFEGEKLVVRRYQYDIDGKFPITQIVKIGRVTDVVRWKEGKHTIH